MEDDPGRENYRIMFMVNRDGLQEALEWGRRAMLNYRRAVLQNGKFGRKFCHASTREYKRSYIQSYLCLKNFVHTDGVRFA
ncbi:MAG: hypothetical protein KAS32_00670 [Candidatus Peribacteraceae bacterium]|nr:hypothetical protein [Candidatus Peribacteraceae bacterium]